MVIDLETNFLYLADSLPKNQKDISIRLEKALSRLGIEFEFLPNTTDIWAVDYMPIQVDRNTFVQFVYDPDYLRKSKKWRSTITEVDKIPQDIFDSVINSNIVLDGGNVIRWNDKVIMCDKVFKENPIYSVKQLKNELEKLFQVDRIIFLPQDPNDEIGHADGMVRFLDSNTVIINDYSQEDKHFRYSFISALENTGLDYEVLPYNPYLNKSYLQANGTYLNYLQMSQSILMPVFGMKEDEIAIKRIETFFPGSIVVPIESNELASEGGILNCISWNIWRNK